MRTAAICPTCATYLNAVCVLYDGPAVLTNIPASPLDNMDQILVALNTTIGNINTAIAAITTPNLQIVLNAGNSATNQPVILNSGRFYYTGNTTKNLFLGTSISSLPGITNVVIGYVAGVGMTGDRGIVIGQGAGNTNSGDDVVAIGDAACFGNSGSSVNALGSNAAFNNSGTFVLGIGGNAAKNNSGNNVYAIGEGAALSNSGADVYAIGRGSADNNQGSDVNAFGRGAGDTNSGSNVNMFGLNSGNGNGLSGMTIFSNSSLPSYANHAAAIAAINTLSGASAGCTYLYHNQATDSIGAVRIP